MRHRFHFFCPSAFEPWDWRSVETGTGGSETAVIELTRRLAARGHDVAVYGRVPADVSDDGPVRWMGIESCNPRQPGIWISCRSPKAADFFQPTERLRLWLQCQDSWYGISPKPNLITKAQAAKFEHVLALCPIHKDFLIEQYPFLDGKVVLSSNGIESAFLANLKPQERDPFRLIWPSSPDRGLDNALKILDRAREYEPRLTMHVFYGWNNADKVIAKCPTAPLARLKREIAALPQEGVVWRGRVGRSELWREFQRSSIWLYSTRFPETSAISCMYAQALGAIPICPPIWALGENVRHGVSIAGDILEPLIRVRYVEALLELVWNQALCQQIRARMQLWALEKFDWERVVDQYCDLADGAVTYSLPVVEKAS
jgi:glycosyltransferase involved in cell wall biosynthesis